MTAFLLILEDQIALPVILCGAINAPGRAAKSPREALTFHRYVEWPPLQEP